MKKKYLFTLLIFSLFFIPNVNAESSASIVNHSSYTDSDNYYVVGEVQNTGSVSLTGIKVTAIFYDISGQAVDGSFAYTHLSVLPSGEKTSFQIILKNSVVIPLIDHYILSLDYAQAVSTPPLKLVIRTKSNYTDFTSYLHIIGEVENQGNDTREVRVYFTGYNYLGEVVLTAFTEIYQNDLEHRETAPFDLMIYHEQVSLIDNYVLIASSRDYRSEVIPEFPSPLILLTVLIGVLLLFKHVKFDINRLFT